MQVQQVSEAVSEFKKAFEEMQAQAKTAEELREILKGMEIGQVTVSMDKQRVLVLKGPTAQTKVAAVDGPTLKLHLYNPRATSPAYIKDFYDKTSGLTRLKQFDKENSLVLLIDKKCINTSKIKPFVGGGTIPREERPDMVFLPGSEDAEFHLVNGHHRLALMEYILKAAYEARAKLIQQLNSLRGNSNVNSPQAQNIRDMIQEQNEIIYTTSQWTATVYEHGEDIDCLKIYINRMADDLYFSDAVNKHPRAKELLACIASNMDLFNTPDSVNDTLQLILRSLKDTSDIKSCKEFIDDQIKRLPESKAKHLKYHASQLTNTLLYAELLRFKVFEGFPMMLNHNLVYSWRNGTDWVRFSVTFNTCFFST